MTWIEADITCINLTSHQYIALVPAIVYVSNDEWRHNPIQHPTQYRSKQGRI